MWECGTWPAAFAAASKDAVRALSTTVWNAAVGEALGLRRLVDGGESGGDGGGGASTVVDACDRGADVESRPSSDAGATLALCRSPMNKLASPRNKLSSPRDGGCSNVQSCTSSSMLPPSLVGKGTGAAALGEGVGAARRQQQQTSRRAGHLRLPRR